MSRKKKVKILKLVLLVLAIILFAIVTVYLIPVMRNLSTPEGQIRFKEKVANSGWAGVLLLFGIQFAQIFLFVFPGEPVEIIAGMCYGPVWGTIFVMVSIAIITTIIFFLVKKLGRRFVYDFCDEKQIDKFMNNKIFKNPKKIEFIMFILFFLPGTPKDLLVYLAGLLPLKPLRFILISTLVRFPSVISSTLAGAHLATGNWKMSVVIYAVTLLIVGIALMILNLFDKNKTTEDVIKSINSK